MNGRNKVARILVALGAIVLFGGALLHCLAAYPRVMGPALSASNLSAPLQGALRAVFLLVGWDWVVIGIIALIGAFTATRIQKVIVLVCGFALVGTTAVMLKFIGWFLGTDMILAAAVMIICGGLLLGKNGE
ncbi:MAG: hypothetical protein WBR26_07255 [Candidatus Acidiferrum sp.]